MAKYASNDHEIQELTSIDRINYDYDLIKYDVDAYQDIRDSSIIGFNILRNVNKENNGEFTSTKNDKVLPHGIGIKNVRKVVSNLNGHIDFSYSSECFSVKAELPNYS